MNANFIKFKNAVINIDAVKSVRLYENGHKVIFITYKDGSYEYAYNDVNEDYYNQFIQNFPNLYEYLSDAFYITSRMKC